MSSIAIAGAGITSFTPATPAATDSVASSDTISPAREFLVSLLSGFPPVTTNVWGQADSATPVDQTFQVESATAGSVNVSGGNWIENLGKSTGTGTAGLLTVNGGFAGVTTSATCTITIGSPTIVALASHGFVPGQPIQFSTTGALPTGMTAGTQYYVIVPGWNTTQFEFSATPFGAAVNTSGVQSGTQTCTAQSNVQNPLQASVIFGPAALTGSQNIPTLQINQTWNTSAAVDAALFINITADTNHLPVGAKALDIQLDALSIVNCVFLDSNSQTTLNLTGVQGNCALTMTAGSSTSTITGTSFGDILFGNKADGQIMVLRAGLPSRLKLGSSMSYAWTSGTDPNATATDTMIYRDAVAGVVALTTLAGGASVVRAYNTTDQVGTGTAPTNFERMGFDWQTSTNVGRVRSEAGGTGTIRIIAIDGFSKSGAAVVGDLPTGTWGLIHDTAGATTKLCYNDAGTLRTVALV